jgi:hypothetical protein
VLEKRCRRRSDVVRPQQRSGVSRVLARDERTFAQRFERTRREVLEIPERGRDDEKTSGISLPNILTEKNLPQRRCAWPARARAHFFARSGVFLDTPWAIA